MLYLEIIIDRASLIFRPNEFVTGTVHIRQMKGKLEGNILILKAQGNIFFNHPGKKNPAADALHSVMIPTALLKESITLNSGKTIIPEKCSFPFKFKIEPVEDGKLLESYTGVYIISHYEVAAELKSQAGSVTQSQTFYVQIPDNSPMTLKMKEVYPRPLSFVITPENLLKGSSAQNKKLPNFKITGRLNSDIINIIDEIEGVFCVEESDHDFKSIELQLVRVETVENKKIKLIEATEVQNIQIADGNVIRCLELLMHMVLPRFYSVPSFNFKEYTVNFEMNLVFIFTNGFKITQNFPLYIFRNQLYTWVISVYA